MANGDDKYKGLTVDDLHKDPEFGKLRPGAQKIIINKVLEVNRGGIPNASDRQAMSGPLRFVSGLGESFGLQPTIKGQVESTKGFYKALGQDPLGTLKSTASAGFDAAKQLTAEISPTAPIERGMKAGEKLYEGYKSGHTAKGVGEAVEQIVPFGMGRGAGTIARGDTARGAGQLTGSAIQLLSMTPEGRAAEVTGIKAPYKAPAAIARTAKDALADMVGQGPTAEKMQIVQDSYALGTKGRLAKLETAVHDDAQGLMRNTAQTVDRNLGGKAVEIAPIREAINKSLGEKIHTDETLPASLREIIENPTVTRSTGPTVGGRKFDLSNPTDLQAFNRMKEQGVFTKSEIAKMEGESTEGAWGFEKAKELRTNIGRDLFSKRTSSMPGNVRSAMFDTYGTLTKQLQSAADRAGVGAAWKRANFKWENYRDTFKGKYERGEFHDSPIAQSLSGQNATDIINPLSGKEAARARDLLSKYPEFGADIRGLVTDLRRARYLEQIGSFGKLNNRLWYLALLAAWRPEWALYEMAGYMGVPYLLRRIATKGVETTGREIPRISPEPQPPTPQAAPQPPPTQ